MVASTPLSGLEAATRHEYQSSTQRRYWHWHSQDEIDRIRMEVHSATSAKLREYAQQRTSAVDVVGSDAVNASTTIDPAMLSTTPATPRLHNSNNNVQTPSTLLQQQLHLSASPVTGVSVTQHNAEMSTTVPQPDPSTVQDVDALSLDECRDLILYYAQSIPSICTIMSFPVTIQHSTLTLFHRFYLHTSVMQYHPKLIMLACFWICGKAEDHWIKLDQLADRTKTAAADIAQYELTVLNQCKFHLRIYHPVRPLHGLCTILSQQYNHSINDTAKQRALQLIDYSYYNDTIFLYAPAQIALAALYSAADGSTVDSEMVHKLLSSQAADNVMYDKLLLRLRGIQAALLQAESLATQNRHELKQRCEPLAGRQRVVEAMFHRMSTASEENDSRAREAARKLKLQQRAAEMQKQRDELLGIGETSTTHHTQQNGHNDSEDEDVGFRIKRRKSKHNALIDED